MTSFQLTEDPQIVRRDDGLLCRVELGHYQAFLSAGGVPLPADPPTTEQLAAIAQAAQDKADASEAKTYAKLAALKNMTPTQVLTWVDANVTTLAQAKDAIKTLAIAVSILARKL